ncbi:uncharacterized protein PAC_11323 [Phialocephala subalpina]|uniref:Uncharacterized protein n=1 Tax=Phialocephala subalpina TaxID=576137 RepID=A0A1L7X8W2_9HELO|nr:uncharacterized protein PAC_11323 [Phialocephala subalpina]
MLLDSSLEEGLDSLYHLYMDPPHRPSSSSLPPSATRSSSQSKTQSQSLLITTPPELRLRNPVPEPQAADCSQADQSASQAIQQATQQASQSIQQAQQQASQSASQASQQAAQSASQAIQQFSNSASQSIAAASRSVASAISSASQAVAAASSSIASAQSSAAAAISRANGSMVDAQVSLTVAQSQASAAVLQAGAAVAAATGSAAAAGSSFLAAAAKATQSAQASVSAIGAQASQQVSQASQQVVASQNAAVTATQAALAIVGSIIASALVTILIFFLVARHKKKAKAKSRADPSLGNVYFADPKFPPSDQAATTAVPSQSAYTANRDLDPMSGSQVTFSLFPKASDENPSASERKKNEELRKSIVKSTSVPWNPNKPPKAPTLGSWLKLQDGVSPFGPIKLPLDDEKSNSPLGGQLKSPMTSNPPQRSPRMSSGIPIPIRSPGLAPNRSPKLPVLMDEPSVAKKPSTINAVPKSPLTLLPVKSPKTPKNPDTLPQHSIPGPQYRESKASVWTDDLPDPSPSPPLQTPPPELRGKGSVDRRPINSMQKVTNMEIPPPVNPIRNTAEWFAERARLDNGSRASRSQFQSQYGSSSSANAENSKNNRPSFGLPRGPRLGGGVGLPSQPGPNRGVLRSSQAELGYVQGLNRFLGKDSENGQRGSLLSRMGSDRSANASTPGGRSALNTPGVGKAL